jgi:hypothetical protein
MTFFSGFTFTFLVAFTHFPLFCLYVVWFKNGLMRFEAAREALVTRGVIKRRSSQQRGKSRIRGNATELERKNNDDIIAEQTEEEEKRKMKMKRMMKMLIYTRKDRCSRTCSRPCVCN